eukprot:c6421_g1_i1.p1 GENE.c6421_g1_i1~~c6421_g1_i1.p1  ORF type:complete len:161 (-),score=44.64 c6421_g1_i1:44-526(-)
MAALEGKKWRVENLKEGNSVTVNPADFSESVYLFNCKDTVVTISAKVTSISIVKCERVGVVFSGTIASCEAVNCKSLQIQMRSGDCPSFVIDNSSKVVIFIDQEVRPRTQFISSHCQELLVTVLRGDNLEPIELPVPEQFVSKFDDTNHLITEPTAHLGV